MRRPLLIAGLTVITAVILGAAETRGDVLETIEGETMTGKVVEVADGQLTVEVTKDGQVESQSIRLSDLRGLRLVPELFDKDARTELLVDNRRTEENEAGQEHEASAKIKLRKGHHAFTLVSWQKDDPPKLSMEVSGPGGEFQPITPEVLGRLTEGAEITPSPGSDDEGFRLPETGDSFESGVHYEVRNIGERTITSVAELRGLPQVSSGQHRQLDLSLEHPEGNFAVIFRGFFSIQEDGEYGAKLKCAGNAQLFLGPTPAILQPSTEENAEGQWQVRFRDAGRVQGTLASWEGERCLVKYQIARQTRELSIPAMELTELWPASSKPEELQAERENEPNDLDSVYAKGKGDRIQRVSGTVLGIANDALRFEYQEKERTISLDRVVGIVMRTVERTEAERQTAAHRLVCFPAASVPGRLTNISTETVTLELPWGERFDAQRNDILEIIIALGRFQPLSELEPLEVAQTPFFDRVIPLTVDKSLTGGTLQIGGKKYEKGLCLPSRTELSYALDGEFDRFRCSLGLQETEGDTGNATVKVLADGDVLLEIDELTGGQDPQEVDLDVAGRQRLTLLVDFGKNLHIGDHVVWANAHLLRVEETP